MGTFRFSLQPALNVAVSREREEKVAAARARARVDEARAALGALETRERQLTRQARLLQSIAVPASQWIATEFFAARLRDLRTRHDRASAAAASANDAALASLEQARNGRIALDALREKRRIEHVEAQALRDAADLDESNAGRSRRTEHL